MKRQKLRGLFDFEDRMREIASKDPLARLADVVDWEVFRAPVENAVQKTPKAPGGRPRFDAVIMFKTIVIQRLYHLSDAQTEFMIRDRLSFMKFVGVDLYDDIPDEKTIWRFKEEMITAGVMDQLWAIFNRELDRLGVKASRGKIIDASIVETVGAPRKKQKSTDSDAPSVADTDSETAEESSTRISRERQTDTDARWTVKRKKAYYGYKNHIKIDAKTKLVVADVVTYASVHDRVILPKLLDEATDKDCELYADKGYAGAGSKVEVYDVGAKARIMHKGKRNAPVTDEQKAENRTWAKIRSRVEHVFGDQRTSMRFTGVRSRGFPRAEFTIRMNNLVYNLKRLGFLLQTPVGAIG